MRGTKGVTKRLIAFVLSFIMVTGTFMTDYTIVRASEEVEETTSDVEEASEAEESEEPEAEEEPEAAEEEVVEEETETTEEEVVEEETETTEDEVIEEETEIAEDEVVEEETETTEEVVGEELTDEELLQEEVLEEEIIEIIEEMIKISFEAGKGGSVSVSEQELGAEDDVEEVTATADEGYEFVNWTKDGKEVSADETFTPAKEAATYVANFEEVEEELEFNQSVYSYGMKISLYAKPGVLPNDAELQVEKVSSTLEKEIKEAINNETEGTVEETISFDINIYSASAGGYVQPEDGTVSVTFELQGMDTENKKVSVYHVQENGNSVNGVEEVAAPVENADEVGFEAEHFSVYTIVSETGEAPAGMVRVCVYVMDDGWEGNQQKEDQLGLHKKDANGFYPVGVVDIPSEFVDGVSPYLNDDDTWNALKPYLNGTDGIIDTSKNVFSSNGEFKEANGDNHMVDYLDNVNKNYKDIGTGYTALFDWDQAWGSYGFDYDVVYHLDLRMEVRTVTFINGNNDLTGTYTTIEHTDEGDKTVTHDYVKGETVFGTRGYFENEKIENPNASTYDFYLEHIPEGYAVVGYYKDVACQIPYTFGNPIKENEVVYVKLETDKKYTITWKDNDVELKTESVPYGKNTLEQAPDMKDKKNGDVLYVFKGWSVENDGTVDTLPTVVTENATYYAVYEKVADVYYYLLLPNVEVPTDSSSQSRANYYPEEGGNYYDWKGTAVALEKIPAEDKDGFGNVYGEELVKKYLITIPQNMVDEYLAKGDYGYNAEAVWYTYKNTGNELHVDGYVKNAPVKVKYHSNYPEDVKAEMDDKSSLTSEKTGNYTIKGLNEGWKIDGYEFKGWALDKDASSEIYQAGDAYELKTATVFYAVWEKVPASDDENTGDGTGEGTGENTGDGTGEGTGENTGDGTGDSTGENTGDGTDDGSTSGGGSSSGSGSSSGGGSSSDGGSTSGGGRSDSDVGRVLGARREDIATASEDGQVLGAVRAPKTSDASRAILWMLVMGTTALGAAAVLAQKKEEE